MEVHYQLTSDDFYRYQRYWWRHKNKIKPWMYGLMLLAVVVLPSLPIIMQQPLQFVIWIVPSAALLLLLLFLLYKPSMRWQAKLIPGLLAPRVLRIEQTSLVEQTAVAETKINWSQIESMEDGGEATYFFISNRYALLLPWRAFPGPAETQAFLNQARDYWSAAKHGVPLPLDTGDTWPPPPRIGA